MIKIKESVIFLQIEPIVLCKLEILAHIKLKFRTYTKTPGAISRYIHNKFLYKRHENFCSNILYRYDIHNQAFAQ